MSASVSFPYAIRPSLPGEPSLRARLFAVLDAIRDLGGHLGVFSDAYPGDLRGDLKAWATSNEGMSISEVTDPIDALEIGRPTHDRIAIAYFEHPGELLGDRDAQTGEAA